MHEQRLAAACHPTTVLLIDDKERYLAGIHSGLNKKKALYQLYTDPQAALRYLTNEYKPNYFTERCILRPEEDERDHRHIEVDVVPIREEAFNPHRFEQISVIVVDQEMPGLKGLDICRQLSASPIKKLLLTGEATNEQAIDAFNNGIIDKFINKKADNFNQTLNNAIFELQQDYFKDLSTIIINSITKNIEHHNPSCLDDPVFIHYFTAFCEKNQFSEFYLTDTNGSFMFVDFNGKPSFLAVKDDLAMRGPEFDSEVADIKPSKEAIERLANREQILYLHNPDDLKHATDHDNMLDIDGIADGNNQIQLDAIDGWTNTQPGVYEATVDHHQVTLNVNEANVDVVLNMPG